MHNANNYYKCIYKCKIKENDSLNWGFGAGAEFFLVLLFLLQIHLEDRAYVIPSFLVLSGPASDATPGAAAYRCTRFESIFFFCCCLKLARCISAKHPAVLFAHLAHSSLALEAAVS